MKWPLSIGFSHDHVDASEQGWRAFSCKAQGHGYRADAKRSNYRA